MIGNKIKSLRKNSNLSQGELADKLNAKYPEAKFGKGKISKWENSQDEPKLSAVVLLADFFDVSIDYFMDRKTDIQAVYDELDFSRQDKVLSFAHKELETQNHELDDELFEVEGTTYAAAAQGFGHGSDADDYDTYTVYTDEEPPYHDYAIGVKGDSMLPKYEEGDMLYLVDRGLSYYNGQLCIVVIDGQTYFKKVYTEDNGLRLVSLNRKYDDIFVELPPEEDTYIRVYDVVGSFTPIDN